MSTESFVNRGTTEIDRRHVKRTDFDGLFWFMVNYDCLLSSQAVQMSKPWLFVEQWGYAVV